jgi:tight adherence protein B
MDQSFIIPMAVGVAVIVVFSVLGLVLSKSVNEEAEQRLEDLTSGRGSGGKSKADAAGGVLLRPPAIDLGQPAFWTKLIPNAENLNRLYEQADISLAFSKFMMLVLALAISGGLAGYLLRIPLFLVPVGAAFLGMMPFLWLLHRKRKRVKKFLEAMPEAVELVSRALRAGHGLASGLHLVAEEMKGPIADEFGRVFEEQNLGIPIELSLRGMADRIPSLDVRFFVVAVVIQRATGGDLAEVLDKIGRLIRQRFELFGHVKALTAEGRLSGVVLLALPPGLLAFLSVSNYGYVSVLFTTPLGNKMLIITGFLQLLGALMIKKIVAIKV